MKLNKSGTLFFIGALITYQMCGMESGGGRLKHIAPEYVSDVTAYIKDLQPNFETNLEEMIKPKVFDAQNLFVSETSLFRERIQGIKTAQAFFTALIGNTCPKNSDFAYYESQGMDVFTTTISPLQIKNYFITSFFQDIPGHIIFLLGLSHCKYKSSGGENIIEYTQKERENLIKNFIKNFKKITENKIEIDLNFTNLIKNEYIKSYVEILSPSYKTSTEEIAFDYTLITQYLNQIKKIKETEERWETKKKRLLWAAILLPIFSGLGVYFWQDIKNISTKAKTWWNKK